MRDYVRLLNDHKTGNDSDCSFSGRRVTIAGLLPWLLFFPYPLALLAPAGLGVLQRFHFIFPIELVIGLAIFIFFIVGCYRSVGGRGSNRITVIRLVVVALVLFALSLPLLSERHELLPMIRFSTLFSVPLWFGLARRELLPRRLILLMAGLWLAHSAHLLWELATGQPPVGLCGNRNWMVTFTLALTPWIWLAAGALVDSNRKIKANPVFFLTVVVRLGVLLIAFSALWFGRSRAAWLLLAVYLLWWLLVRLSPLRVRVVAVALIGTGLLALAVNHRERLTEWDDEDVRLHMWRSSALMIADQPLTGVGAGNFRRDFPLYRMPEQTASPKVAPVTDHPHNEILYVAASLGVPVALLWVFLLFPLIAEPPSGKGWGAVHFSAFILVGHGMLDLTMARQPTALLGLICLGLLWRQFIPCRVNLPDWRRAGRDLRNLRPPQWVGAGAIALLAVFLVYRETAYQWHMRRGAVAEVKEDVGTAFEAYLRAGRFALNQVEPFAYAGNAALFRLDQPERALELFAVAADMEPYFGHMNRNIGIALARLGKDRQALRFFTREARLFPFDHIAQFNLLAGKLATGNLADIEQMMPRLGAAVRNTLNIYRSSEQTRQLTEQFRTAVENGESGRALVLAGVLTAPVARGGVLPEVTREVLALMPLDRENDQFSGHEYQEEDALYWQWLAHGPGADEVGLSGAWARTVHKVEQKRCDFRYAAVLRTDKDGEPLALVVDKAQFLQIELLVDSARRNTLTLDKNERGLVELDAWNEALQALGIAADDCSLVIPVSPWDVLERNRVLAVVLGEHGVDDLLPAPLPPAFRFHRWRRGALRELLSEERLKIDYHPWKPGTL